MAILVVMLATTHQESYVEDVDVAYIKTKKHMLLFYSTMQASLTIPAVAANQALPSVEIKSGAIPTDATKDEVYCHFLFGSLKDKSGSDNMLDGAQYLKVKKTAGGTYTNAILFADNTLPIDVSEGTVRGSGMVYGNLDVSDEVDGEGIYDFQWALAKCDGADLELTDIILVIEVRYH